MKSTILLDTNLLLLFTVGSTKREYVEKHKRLSNFCLQDFDLLAETLSAASAILLFPNTLTETSNLAAYIEEPARSEIFHTLRTIIHECDERFVTSKAAIDCPEFIRLGLADSVLLSQAEADFVVLTADLDLYVATVTRGSEAVNFNHLRDSHFPVAI
ncbi:hypothetical protein [Abyssibacter profundi]|uniref:PIN domain-containing protein n=1 Tax=Abyssibacter profundi TaxID=2182787 RepID=A0A363ULC2_9GAMM|nr:hypothetical protein [Abyssibacter profundi]PWN56197.1 hypothetical protein DEH80_07950 [Abyssibacter profundi]